MSYGPSLIQKDSEIQYVNLRKADSNDDDEMTPITEKHKDSKRNRSLMQSHYNN